MRKEDSEYWKSKMPDAFSIASRYYAHWTDEECTTDNIADAMKEYTTKVLDILESRIMDVVDESLIPVVSDIIDDTINNLK